MKVIFRDGKAQATALDSYVPQAGEVAVTAHQDMTPTNAFDWEYKNNAWVAPSPVPKEITMQQARKMLFSINKLAAVDQAINAMSEPARTQAKIEWEYSNAVLRRSPLVAQLGPALGLTDQDIDQLFIQGSQLT